MKVDELNQDMVSVIPDQIVMQENTELTMYTIKEWKIIYINESNPESGGVKMVIVLKRKNPQRRITLSPIGGEFNWWELNWWELNWWELNWWELNWWGIELVGN